jgi:hypothetical protein
MNVNGKELQRARLHDGDIFVVGNSPVPGPS